MSTAQQLAEMLIHHVELRLIERQRAHRARSRRVDPERPDYICCIERLPNSGSTWCNRYIGIPSLEFAFTGLDHAAANADRDGRLLCCRRCVQNATDGLLQQTEDQS